MDKRQWLSKVVRVSPELFAYVQQFAEPLKDDFDSACRKALKMPERKPKQ